MKKNIIYRNINFKPRIWGVSYTSLFSSIFIWFITFFILRHINLLTGFFVSIFIAFICYIFYYWNDNIKDRFNVQINVNNNIECFSYWDWEIKIK